MKNLVTKDELMKKIRLFLFSGEYFKAQVATERYLNRGGPFPDIVFVFDTAIKNARTDEDRAELRLQKGTRCMESSLWRIAESEILKAVITYESLKVENKRKRGMQRCYNRLVGIYHKMGEYEEAARYLEKYKELMVDEGEKRKKQEAIYLEMLATILIDQGELKLAEEKLIRSCEINAQINNQMNLTKSLLELGRVSWLLRKFKIAEEYLKKAKKKIDTIHEEAIYYERCGAIAYDLNEYTTAHRYYRKVFEMNKITPMDDTMSQTSRLLGELFWAQGEYEKALQACDMALEVALALGQKIEIGVINRLQGQIHDALGDKQKAKEHFQESILFLDKIGAKYEVGRAYLESGKSDAFAYPERKAYLDNAKKIFEEIGIKYYVALASKSQRSLSKPTTAKELEGIVKAIDKDESAGFVEFDVAGAPLEMEIPLLRLEKIKADYTGARIRFATEKKHGETVPIFQKLAKPEYRSWHTGLRKA